MRASFLIVVACFHLGGSYYNQTSLSSVLSAFEARLTVPRSKEAEQSAPVSTAVPASAVATLMPADVTSEDTPAAATLMPADVTSEDTSAAATQMPADVSSEDTSAAATQMPVDVSTESTTPAIRGSADVSTMSTESDVTKGSMEVSATSNPTFMSTSIGEESPTSSEGLLQEHEVGQVEDTLPSAALPSHLATNSGSSRIWTYKEVSLVAHVGQVMWLTVLTGISFHFIGATAHLWHAVYDLRRARA